MRTGTDTAVTQAQEQRIPLAATPREPEQNLEAKRAEFRELVRSKVEGRMHKNGLRKNEERNRLIDEVYCTFKDSKALNALSLSALTRLIDIAKKLGVMGTVMEMGKRNSPFMSLEAYLAKCQTEEEKKQKTEEYYLSEVSISDEMLKNFQYNPEKVREMPEIPRGRGAMHIDDVVRVCKAAGFSGKNLVTIVAIGGPESDYNPNCHYRTSREDSYGLFQINWKVHRQFDRNRLCDPLYNAQCAFRLSGGSNFRPWSTYKDGKYRRRMAAAEAAVARVEAGG